MSKKTGLVVYRQPTTEIIEAEFTEIKDPKREPKRDKKLSVFEQLKTGFQDFADWAASTKAGSGSLDDMLGFPDTRDENQPPKRKKRRSRS